MRRPWPAGAVAPKVKKSRYGSNNTFISLHNSVSFKEIVVKTV
jgi:hypothetical protein